MEDERCDNSNRGRLTVVKAPFDGGESEVVVDSCGAALVGASFDGGERVEVVDRFGVISTGVIEGEKGDDGVLDAWRPDD